MKNRYDTAKYGAKNIWSKTVVVIVGYFSGIDFYGNLEKKYGSVLQYQKYRLNDIRVNPTKKVLKDL